MQTVYSTNLTDWTHICVILQKWLSEILSDELRGKKQTVTKHRFLCVSANLSVWLSVFLSQSQSLSISISLSLSLYIYIYIYKHIYILRSYIFLSLHFTFYWKHMKLFAIKKTEKIEFKFFKVFIPLSTLNHQTLLKWLLYIYIYLNEENRKQCNPKEMNLL